MTDFLPLFPLKMVVFPGEHLNLHVFEPRYKQLIRECEENGVTFGMPAFINNKIMEMGTELELVAIEKKYANGEMDIITQGIGLFKINELFDVTPKKLYSGADITRLAEEDGSEPELNARILEELKELFRILGVEKKMPENANDFVTRDVAHHVGFSIEQEYDFLCITSEIKRQEFIYEHLERLVPIVREMERLRLKAQLNGHFKNAMPPDVD